MNRRITALLLALLFSATAVAQELARLLPADTILALGIQDLALHQDRLGDFVAEFERLGVADAFTTLLGDGMNGEGAPSTDGFRLPEGLQGLTVYDLLGQEAWIAVSISAFNPLPSLTLTTRLSPDAATAVAELLAREVAAQGIQELTEGDYSFYLQPVQDPDVPVSALAFAQAGEVLMLSSDPDTMRGLLRQLGGSSDPALTDSEAYMATLGRLGPGNAYGFMDYTSLAALIEPYAAGLGAGMGMGLDQLADRTLRAMDTTGVSAGVVRITDEGASTFSVQALNGNGKDVALFLLLTAGQAASRTPLDFMPASGLGISSSYTDLAGWWNYLNGVIATDPGLGFSSLDEAFGLLLGVDPGATFFRWAGTRVATITTGLGEPLEPGMPSSNLLGEIVLMIESLDDQAARQGLALLLNNLAVGIASFADQMGGGGSPASTKYQVGDVTVNSYQIIEGLKLATAVTDGFALIATSEAAMDAVLAARAAGSSLQPTLSALLPEIPADARSYSLNDNRATLEGTARQLASQLQVLAGLGGAANLDFDAVQQASGAVEAYLVFVASRLGGSVGYATVDGNVVVGFGRTEVSW